MRSDPPPAPRPSPDPRDEAFMDLALGEARAAGAADEVPIGAVIVRDGEVIARGHNRTNSDRDPTAHAEMIAIRAAVRALAERGAEDDDEGRERRSPVYTRLDGCTVYTTVEPCFMCAGALMHARVERVVWGVRDPKFGGAASLGRVLDDPRANHRAELAEGVRAGEARTLLQDFFREKRGP